MNRFERTMAAATAVLATACASPETNPESVLDAARAFARMKTLAGEYEGNVAGIEGTTKVSYEVTSGGHALLEKISEGTEHEMTSVYFLEGRDLAMVHYCAMGNRPHLRLDREHSTLDDLLFVWDGTATDIDPTKDAHIHGAHFVCSEPWKPAEAGQPAQPGKVVASWTFWQEGKESHVTTFHLERTPPPPADATALPVPPTTPETSPPPPPSGK